MVQIVTEHFDLAPGLCSGPLLGPDRVDQSSVIAARLEAERNYLDSPSFSSHVIITVYDLLLLWSGLCRERSKIFETGQSALAYLEE